MAGNQIFPAATTGAGLRYGALVAGWSEARAPRRGDPRHHRRSRQQQAAHDNRRARIRLPSRWTSAPGSSHANDLWIAASAIHIGAPLLILTGDNVFDDTPGLTLHK